MRANCVPCDGMACDVCVRACMCMVQVCVYSHRIMGVTL